MKPRTATMDFSMTLKIMLAMLLTAGLVLSSALSATAGDRGRHGHASFVKKSHWRDGNRVVVFRESPRHHVRDVRAARHFPRHHKHFKRVRVGHKHYYTHGGRYYEKGPRGFLSIAPPYGAWILSLPIGSARLTIGGSTYFRHQQTYYQAGPGGYVVVAPPRPALRAARGRVVW